MRFEKFTETSARMNVSASINEKGVIGFSSGARHRFNLEHGTFIALYYDRESQQIGIELAVDKDSEGARQIVVGKSGAIIRAKNFVDFFNIPISGTLRLPVTVDPETGLLVLDLKVGKLRKGSLPED